MKVEIIDMKRFKLIAENRAEEILLSEWIGVFKYTEGRYTTDIAENIYKFEKTK